MVFYAEGGAYCDVSGYAFVYAPVCYFNFILFYFILLFYFIFLFFFYLNNCCHLSFH